MLKGTLVNLRSIEKDDLKTLHQLERNVELVQFGDGQWMPSPLAAWEKQFEKELESKEFSSFAIEADGTLIGGIGLHHLSRRDSSSQFGIGIYHPDYVGKGYGREAISLLLDWAFFDQNWRRIWLEALSVNQRAVRAYRALGFVEEGRLRQHSFFRGEYVDVFQMGMLREEWAARKSGR
ncbi:MAG: GNAT family N-acetyltransferase [Roseiflexaceae bacterium]|nr:GNAT family N-acetyltransferase [Roseiflexaceae bacterium]